MKKLYVELVNETEGEYECALMDEGGNEKYKFTIKLSHEDLQDMTEGIIYRDKITRNALYRELKEEIIGLISEKCREFNEDINYEDLSRYDNMAAGDIVSSLSGWIEQRVYDYFNSIYDLNEEQLQEMKKFYKEGIDLNLAIKRNEKTSILGSKMLTAKEMEKIRISKEREWTNNREKKNNYKDSLKFDGVIMPKENKEVIDITPPEEIGRSL